MSGLKLFFIEQLSTFPIVSILKKISIFPLMTTESLKEPTDTAANLSFIIVANSLALLQSSSEPKMNICSSSSLEYDMAIGDVLSPIYTLLFDLALKEALGRTATQGNVYLIVDELKLLPNLRHLEDGINFGRSLGVKILAGLQSIDQLNASYGNEAVARNIVSGFSSVYAFRSNDYSTRKYVSELFGRNMVFEKYPIASGQYHCERREGFSVEDWDMTDLSVGEAIVGLPSAPPFRFKFDLFVK